MLVPFHEMPSTARIWIYQAKRFMTPNEQQTARQELDHFAGSWESHGQALKASYELRHDLFVIIAVDEAHHNASGCSIDKAVHVMKTLEDKLGIAFFDRTILAYKDNKEAIQLVGLEKLPSLVKSGEITEATPVFNNLCASLDELKSSWLKPANETWVKRYFNQVTA